MNSIPDAPELPPHREICRLLQEAAMDHGGTRLGDLLCASLAVIQDAARQPEPVAWVDVPDTDIGPYEFHGMKLLPVGKHHLYAQPPADLKDGWVMVPKEPTEDMIDSGVVALLQLRPTKESDAEACYRAMLSSAPTGEKP